MCNLIFFQIHNSTGTGKIGKMAFGMASNLFHLRHNFLTHFVQTHGNLCLICNDCLRPSGHFADLACSFSVVFLVVLVQDDKCCDYHI